MVHDMTSLDQFDLKLLAALQDDGRLSNQDLADKVGLSASQCSRRRLRLEEEGVIRRYRAELAPEPLGLAITAFISVTLATHSPNNSRRFRDLARQTGVVRETHALAGSMDYLIKVTVADLKALSTFINDTLLPHDSVQHVQSSIVLETIKEGGGLSFGE